MPKILIADDSIAVRKVAERLLTEAGMGVTLAANGSEALAMLAKDRPDLIVSDVIMPDKSGYEVCAFIRGQANLADLPVLLISGIVNDEVSRQAETCKADGVLKKPFQGSSLKDRVLDLLTKRPHKPAPVSEPIHIRMAEPPVIAEVAPAPVSPMQEELSPGPSAQPECKQPVEPVAMAMDLPSAASAEQVRNQAGPAEVIPSNRANEPSPLVQADNQYQSILAERDARITELEEQLGSERRHSQGERQQNQLMMSEQREQIAELSSRTQALESHLSEERAHRDSMTRQLEDLSRQAHRLNEVEAALLEERHRAEQLAQQVSEGARLGARIVELEAHLEAEREAANQLVSQITNLEHVEGRMKELERVLAREREEAMALRNERAQLEKSAAMVPALEEAGEKVRAQVAELDATLTAERDAAAALLAQYKQMEEKAERGQELEQELSAERDHSMQLTKRVADAELMAEQSTRRFEDLARKLGEIAGLASQLGNAKR
ncbi:MAG: putative Response regulator [Nitrospira sp.]